MAEVKSVIEPNRILDDLCWKSVPFVHFRFIHSTIVAELPLTCQYHLKGCGIKDIALLGYSLGGNVTLKYMGETTTDSAIRCAIAISVPMKLNICSDTMNQGFARIYQASLLRRLINKMQLKRVLLETSDLHFPDPHSMRNFRQFDDSFTAPIHGFDSADHYYHSCSSRQFLIRIEKPTLIIQSVDDPFMTTEVLPGEHELSDSVNLELSTHGGHVGFIGDNQMHPRLWLQNRIHRFLHDQQFFNPV
jgi:predicted alpha/beta-fold hydrolase